MPTIFQKLGRTFGSGVSGATSANYTRRVNNYSGLGSDDVIYTAKNKEDYIQKLSQLKQQRLLAKQWRRAQIEVENNALTNQTEVQMMYREADMMDLFPEIGAALDIYMEEGTYSRPNGQMINVISKSERIKSILEDLLYNRLTANIIVPMIMRSTVKYGNTFMLLNITDDNGIIGWKQLPVYEQMRFENGMNNPYSAGFADLQTMDLDKENSTKFVWYGKNEYIPYRNWQIAHFRLLYDSLYLPYGVSLLNKARRHWRMLSIMEDMMLMYRLERSIERRVFKVNVGAIDEQDVPAYMDKVANEFKRTPIIDPLTGQLDLRRNVMPVWKNTPIPLLDGRIITIEQLAKEYENGKQNFVYSIQDGTQGIVPGKVVWCGKNYTAQKMIKVTLDDGGYVVLAPEHEFIMRDGSRKRADEIMVGDSVMPFYTKCDKTSKKKIERYEQTYNPNTGKYEYTHRLIANDIPKPVSDKKINTVHHKDYNKYNNNPNNLLWCNFDDHKKMHSQVARNNWSDPDKRRSTSNKISNSKIEYYKTHEFPEDIKNKISNTLKKTFSDPKYKEFFKERGQVLVEYSRTPEGRQKTSRVNKEQHRYEKYFKPYNQSELHREHNKLRSIAMRNFWMNGDVESAKRKMTVVFDDFIWNEIRVAVVKGIIYNRITMLEYINTYLIEHLLEINTNRRLHNLNKISRKVLEERIHEIGYNTITEYISSIKKNHKVIAIEIVEGDDVYCMTVEGLNSENDRHNFAVCGIGKENEKSGCFVSNCNLDDFFIPVRSPEEPNPIETLSAGQNITAMDDIKFVQNKLCTALRVPKSFLNFEEATGDGKNLSLLDVRFTKTVNRVQQMILMELNKVCIIHLYLLGFEDDLTNFSLTMNNPSSQAEMMELDNMSKKIEMAKSAVADPGGGLPLMSVTRACKEILGMSDKEIEDNLEELRLEKALAAELEGTANIIKKTGLFDRVDNLYGDIDAMNGQGGNATQGNGQQDGAMGGGAGSGGMMGGAPGDMGDMGGGDTGTETGAEGDMAMGDAADMEDGGAQDSGDTGSPDSGTLAENFMERLRKKTINEAKKAQMEHSERAKHYEKLLTEKRSEYDKEKENDLNIPLYQKTFLINEELNSIAHNLNKKLTEDKKTE